MGSEGPSPVTVHVTGFKRFHGVADNPTERITRNLQSFVEKRGLPKGLVLGSCTVLEAAGQGALGPLYELLESTVLGREYGSLNQDQVILLHFGANSGSHRFALENQAVHEATFRCPDELGWKPQRVPIMSSDGSILHARQTTLPVKEISKSLQQMGYDVTPSDDAGRFVCNYVYYHSLRFAEKHGIRSLFVHFPLFLSIDEEVQMQFVASLLEVLASLKLQ
ncbi:pyrrolidone-carboxylate peptidase-like [Panicum miliaceum]|uniref:Pyrrolidone-carboxylate peptidase-like n=1 Tax=Panicum miliaceum TaxID=4540 RepID=A0A3L6SH00_PANMI|nr:pyrrolidone-carboxylate peptidase-like [Panicum miliaceum]